MTTWDDYEAMGPVARVMYLRDRVTQLCQLIDAHPEMRPDEQALMCVAELVAKDGGFLAHTLICQIASRSVNGRAVLDRMKQ